MTRFLQVKKHYPTKICTLPNSLEFGFVFFLGWLAKHFDNVCFVRKNTWQVSFVYLCCLLGCREMSTFVVWVSEEKWWGAWQQKELKSWRQQLLKREWKSCMKCPNQCWSLIEFLSSYQAGINNPPDGYFFFINWLNWRLFGIKFPKCNNLSKRFNYHLGRLSIFKHGYNLLLLLFFKTL